MCSNKRGGGGGGGGGERGGGAVEVSFITDRWRKKSVLVSQRIVSDLTRALLWGLRNR